MNRATTSRRVIDAFAHAVIADYEGHPRYPDGAVVLSGDLTKEEFLAAVAHRDPRETPVVLIHEDGTEIVMTVRPPHTLVGRVLRFFGRLQVDIEVRNPEGASRIYHDERYVQGVRGVRGLESRALAASV